METFVVHYLSILYDLSHMGRGGTILSLNGCIIFSSSRLQYLWHYPANLDRDFKPSSQNPTLSAAIRFVFGCVLGHECVIHTLSMNRL